MNFESFITWEMLLSFTYLSSMVFILTEFTKEINVIKVIKTKYYSMLVAFVLIVFLNVHQNIFNLLNTPLYLINSILVSISANGLFDFNHPVDVTKKE